MEEKKITKEESEIKLLQQTMEYITKSLEEMKKSNDDSHAEIKKSNDAGIAEIKKMISDALCQKADKWVENTVKWFLYTVGGIIVSGVVVILVQVVKIIK